MTYDESTRTYVLSSGRRIQAEDEEEVFDTFARLEGSPEWETFTDDERAEIGDHTRAVFKDFSDTLQRVYGDA